MSTFSLGHHELPPLKHFPLAEPIEDLASALKDDVNLVQSLDDLYLNTLSELEPTKRKEAYIKELNKEIEAIFRINSSIAVLMFSDTTLYSTNDQVTSVINQIHGPITIGRLNLYLNSAFDYQVSVDCFTVYKPTFKDYKTGTLFNQADLEAGLRPDRTSIDEHMCEWLRQYQMWLEDYLYFNLAQVSKAPGTVIKQRIQNLSTLQTYMLANA
jgi:hypothetical protein